MARHVEHADVGILPGDPPKVPPFSLALQRLGPRLLLGLQPVEQGGIDVVVSDETMPGASGADFLTEVRQSYPATLRLMLTGRGQGDPPLRFSLLGHSFGCRVVCSALERIAKDGIQIPSAVTLDAVLLQAAFNSDELDPDGMYGNVSKLNLRLLVTRSEGDTSLGKWYPIAERLVNLFSGRPVTALGAVGPSAATQTEFGGEGVIAVGPGFTYPAVVPLTERLVAADLSPLHAATGPGDLFSGHHSNIYHDEIYQLIAGFFR